MAHTGRVRERSFREYKLFFQSMSWRLSLVYQCYVSVIHWYFFLNLGYIQASRALMIASIVMGFLGIIATLVGMQCSKVAGENYVLKGRIAGVGGVFFLLQGNSATQWLSRAPECSELPSATDMNLASVYCVCTRSVYNDCSFVVCFQHHSRVLWSTVSRNKVSLFSLNLNLLQLYYYLWTYYWQHFQASCVWINVCTVVWVSSSSSYVMFCIHNLCTCSVCYRYEIGEGLYIGWSSATLALCGGCCLLCSCKLESSAEKVWVNQSSMDLRQKKTVFSLTNILPGPTFVCLLNSFGVSCLF